MGKGRNLFLNLFLFVFGGVFSGIGFFLFIPNLYLILNGNLILGEVVGVDKSVDSKGSITYAPIVKYNCAGNDIEKQSYLHGSFYPKVGEKIEVYCSAIEPEKFLINSFMDKYFGLFFLFFGLIIFIIPVFIYIYKINRKKFISYIKSNGIILNLKVDFVGRNLNYRVNGESPYFIQAQYLDQITNKVYLFKSDYIWYDIEKYVKIGDTVNVYVDGNNYKKYWMDIEFLPKLV